jgi:hypothetical protein
VQASKEENYSKAALPTASPRDRTAWCALLWYHGLDRPGPIPDRMRALGWIKEKPVPWDAHKTLDEKKNLLEEQHVKLNVAKFQTMMHVIYQQNMVAIPPRQNLHSKQVSAIRDILASHVKLENNQRVIDVAICQLLDAHLSAGKDDEPSALALLEEITLQRMMLWTQIRQWFAHDQVHRIQVLLHEKRRLLQLVRNLSRVYPRVHVDEIPEMFRHLFVPIPQRLEHVNMFLELITPSVLESAMSDAVSIYIFLRVLCEYMKLATTHAMSDWIANLLSTWMIR